MNVLSLFDGMSGGRIALERAGIGVDNYFASEIDQHAIKVTQTNYPDTIQLGGVENWREWDLPKIDLVIGGSPCQGFSFSGKALNFKDPRSRLFFEFASIAEEMNPQFFFLENVNMKKESRDIITSYVGAQPFEINSALVSAQNRKRLYWTNIPGVEQPKDKNVDLVDVLENREATNPAAIRGRYDETGKVVQCLEVRKNYPNKSNCLTTVEKDNVLTSLPPGKHFNPFALKLPFRYYTLKEYCRLQTVPENYFDGIVSDSQAKKMLGNGWTVDVIAHLFQGLKQ